VSCAKGSDASLSLNVSGGQPPYRYRWNNGMIVPNRDKIASGHYSVTVTDSLQCKVVFDTVLTQPPAMQVQMKLKSPTCYGYNDGAVEVLNISKGNAPYVYSIDNQLFSDAKVFNRLIASPHLLRVKDAKGCIVDTAIILAQPLKIVVNMGRDTTIEVGEKVNIKAQVNLAPNEISKMLWNDFVTPICPTCLETNVAPTQSTGYLLTIWDKNNCVGRDELFVFVKDLPVFAPTAFSPNDDGTNDYFTLFGNSNAFKIKSLRIYNRWGDTVFEGTNIAPSEATQGWDGKYKGVRQQPAVFVYVAEIELFDGTVKQLKGEVFLAE
jgi:gliding motility-associated-like protein